MHKLYNLIYRLRYMTLTKLETQKIQEYISRMKDDTSRVVIASDKTNLHISKSAYDLLTVYINQHKKLHGRISKARYIRMLLNQFYRDNPAVFHILQINLQDYSKSNLKALTSTKTIFAHYCDNRISTQSDALIALLIYTTVRDHEVSHNLPVTDYYDREFQSQIESGEIIPAKITDPLANVRDLFEEAQDLALPIPEKVKV